MELFLLISYFCFSVFSCYYHRSRPRRNEEEDDNSPHRREQQQQQLEIKAIVWVSPAAHMFLCMVSKYLFLFYILNQFLIQSPALPMTLKVHYVCCVEEINLCVALIQYSL